MTQDAKWYVVHTYSGHENKVKVNIEKMVENRGMEDVIVEVNVPTEEKVEIKNGKKKVKEVKLFPGYVLVKMLMTDESWYIVRNTRGVTGFVGPGSKPVALTEEEVRTMGIAEKNIASNYEIGENIQVTFGPLEGFVALIQEIHLEKHKVKALINMFGRETPVELEFNQIQKLD